jgi:hypothetical protein
MDASQTALASMQDAGDSLVSNLTALQASQDSTSIAVALQAATDTLSQLISTSNTAVNGEFLFGGTNVDSQPLTRSVLGGLGYHRHSARRLCDQPRKASQRTDRRRDRHFITDTVEPMFSESAWTDPTSGWSTASSTRHDQPDQRIGNHHVVNQCQLRRHALSGACIGRGLGPVRPGSREPMPQSTVVPRRPSPMRPRELLARDRSRASSASRRSGSKRQMMRSTRSRAFFRAASSICRVWMSMRPRRSSISCKPNWKRPTRSSRSSRA